MTLLSDWRGAEYDHFTVVAAAVVGSDVPILTVQYSSKLSMFFKTLLKHLIKTPNCGIVHDATVALS